MHRPGPSKSRLCRDVEVSVVRRTDDDDTVVARLKRCQKQIMDLYDAACARDRWMSKTCAEVHDKTTYNGDTMGIKAADLGLANHRDLVANHDSLLEALDCFQHHAYMHDRAAGGVVLFPKHLRWRLALLSPADEDWQLTAVPKEEGKSASVVNGKKAILDQFIDNELVRRSLVNFCEVKSKRMALDTLHSLVCAGWWVRVYAS